MLKWLVVGVMALGLGGFFSPKKAEAAYLVKIGFVDLQKVFQEYEKTKTLGKKLSASREETKKRLDEIREELKELREEINNPALSEEARKKKGQELQAKEQERKVLLENLQSTQQRYTEELLGDIQKKVVEIGIKEGFTLILEKGVLLYGNPEFDLTEKIIKELNKAYEKTP